MSLRVISRLVQDGRVDLQLDAHGVPVSITLNHNPTDDELQTLFPVPVDIVGSTATLRRDLARERADAWNISRTAAIAAQSDPAFTPAERNRLQALADFDRDALRAV